MRSATVPYRLLFFDDLLRLELVARLLFELLERVTLPDEDRFEPDLLTDDDDRLELDLFTDEERLRELPELFVIDRAASVATVRTILEKALLREDRTSGVLFCVETDRV